MMKTERVSLRCDCGSEAIVFTKYDYSDSDTSYDMSFEDSYIGGDYKGFFGRIKRAWKALTDKPLVYTGVFTDDKNKMRKFLTDCLAIIDNLDNTVVKSNNNDLADLGYSFEVGV